MLCQVRLGILDEPRSFLTIGEGARWNVERVRMAPGNDDELLRIDNRSEVRPRYV